MTWAGAEGLVDSVNTYLQANLAAKLDAIDTELSDSLVLEDVVAWYTSEKDLASVQGYPSVFILATDGQIVGWNASYQNLECDVTIAILVLDQTPEDLKKRVYRYVRAIWEVITTGHAARSYGAWQIIGSPQLAWTPIFQDDNSQFISEGRVVFRAFAQETR